MAGRSDYLCDNIDSAGSLPARARVYSETTRAMGNNAGLPRSVYSESLLGALDGLDVTNGTVLHDEDNPRREPAAPLEAR